MPTYPVDSLDNRDPAAMRRAVRLVEAVTMRWHRHRVTGIERIPEGPVLFVGNHSGGLATPDTFLFFHALYRARGLDAVPHGLAHEFVLKLPIFNEILAPLGAVRACHENALRLFAAGRSAFVYPGGDVDSMRPYARRNEVVFGNRRGFIRLALEAGVPIVPVAAAGAHGVFVVLSDLRGVAHRLGADRLFRLKVWPLTLSVPFGLSLGPVFPFVPWPSPVCVEAGHPIYFDRTGPEAIADDAYVAACAARVQGELQVMLTRLADERRAL